MRMIIVHETMIIHYSVTIMIVHPKKQLNKFEHFRIPSNKDLYARVGNREVPMHSDGQIADFNSRKIDALAKSLDMAEEAFYHQQLKERQMPSDPDTSSTES